MKKDNSKHLPQSLIGRIALFYTLLTSALLIGIVLFLFDTLSTNLHEEDQQILAEKVYILHRLLQEDETFLATIAYEIQRGSVVAGTAPYYSFLLRILKPNGAVFIETPGSVKTIPAAAFPTPVSEMKLSILPDKSIKWTAVDGKQYFLLTAQSVSKTGKTYVIQAALDISTEEVLLNRYLTILLSALALGMFLTAIYGALLTRRNTQFLNSIILATRRINANNLNERIDPTVYPQELKPLINAFDQMLERLNITFDVINQFSSDLSHELRTPLCNLMGETEVILSRSRSEAEYRKTLESNLEEYNKLSLLIDSISFLTYTENTNISLELNQLDLYEELKKICDTYAVVAADNDIRIQIQVKNKITLRADRALFRRAVINIIANAIRYTPKGGQIKVTAEHFPNVHSVLISISDSGHGLANEHLPKIFNRFYRVDPARSSDSFNTGLGLAIVKSIMKMHHGTASMKSELGKGTTVYLHFLRNDS